MPIQHNDVVFAILLNELDEACRFVQETAKIRDTANIAAVIFRDFDWLTADLWAREDKIREYARALKIEAVRTSR
jgi:hypothetical protein